MSMSKRTAGEVGLVGALLMMIGSALATTGSETRLNLGMVLALFGVVLLGVGLVIAGHPQAAAQQKSERIPDELNAF